MARSRAAFPVPDPTWAVAFSIAELAALMSDRYRCLAAAGSIPPVRNAVVAASLASDSFA